MCDCSPTGSDGHAPGNQLGPRRTARPIIRGDAAGGKDAITEKAGELAEILKGTAHFWSTFLPPLSEQQRPIPASAGGGNDGLMLDHLFWRLLLQLVLLMLLALLLPLLLTRFRDTAAVVHVKKRRLVLVGHDGRLRRRG